MGIINCKNVFVGFLFDRKQTRKIKNHSKNFFARMILHFNNIYSYAWLKLQCMIEITRHDWNYNALLKLQCMIEITMDDWNYNAWLKLHRQAIIYLRWKGKNENPPFLIIDFRFLLSELKTLELWILRSILDLLFLSISRLI